MLSSKMSHTKLSQKGITKIKFGFFLKKKKSKSLIVREKIEIEWNLKGNEGLSKVFL